jgi:hypothetical protein
MFFLGVPMPLETFASYPVAKFDPASGDIVTEFDPALYGAVWVDPHPHLKRYGKFYGHWLFPDGRVGRYNGWMSRITIEPC